MDLAGLGWDDDFARRFAPWAGQVDVEPGRVLIEFNHIFRVAVGPAKAGPYIDTGPAKAGPYIDTGPAKAGPYIDTGPAEAGPYVDTGPAEAGPSIDTGPAEAGPYVDPGPAKAGPYIDSGPAEAGSHPDSRRGRLQAAREIEATLAGRLKHQAASRAELPAVGDWVAVRIRPGEDSGAIVAVVPRRTKFSRRMAGDITGEQVVAANVDVVFVVTALDGDFSLRRIERYLLLTRESGAAPVILLTKPDLCDDVAARVTEVVVLAGDAPVHVVSPMLGPGTELVAEYLTAGRTGALLGSSGVGKSTIINRLIGADVRKTLEVRESDSTGRHATVHRELVVLPGGGLIIDTPGMRELQLWDVGESMRETFDDVEALAEGCHFTDCRHREEPRCAVKQAAEEGRLAAGRLDSYHKLQDEIRFVERQQDERAQIEEKRRWKVLTKAANKHIKEKRG